jgi:putative transposase
VDPAKAAEVKAVIERFPTYGYRRIAAVLGWNRKVVQRICQRKGWQVNKRPRGCRPRARAVSSITSHPDQRWATDLTRLWCGRDRWCTLALVLDCCTREVLGWRLARRGHAPTAEAALEEALIRRFGHLGRIRGVLTLRSDNGLVFSSRRYMATVKAYGLRQEFITPYTPEQNGLVERFIRSLKEECIWQHRFESLSHARQVIADWIRYYNTQRPHQALGYQTPHQAKKAA